MFEIDQSKYTEHKLAGRIRSTVGQQAGIF